VKLTTPFNSEFKNEWSYAPNACALSWRAEEQLIRV